MLGSNRIRNVDCLFLTGGIRSGIALRDFMRLLRPWQSTAQACLHLGILFLSLGSTIPHLLAGGGDAPDSTVGKSKRGVSLSSPEARDWWAFKPLRVVEPPAEAQPGWARNAIDRFVGRGLVDAGLRPHAEASRAALIRRLTFDLWGIPPSVEQVDAFVADPTPDAYERLVDRLMADSHYGERWARHWLDLVRYADSDGYRVDDFRPNAWRYRDYVIRAFNQDKPYDRFVQEQLAGDELWPEDPDALVATGFLRHGIYEYNNRDAVAQRATLLNDITDTTSEVMLGLSLQCARCHDHKFDPLLQKDYFRLQAFFAGLLPDGDAPVVPPSQLASYHRRLDEWNREAAAIQTEIERIEEPYRKQTSDELRSKFPAETQALMRKPVSERSPLEHQIAELAYRQITHAYERLAPRIKAVDKELLADLRRRLSAFDSLQPPPLPRATIAVEAGSVPPETFIPRKGPEAVLPGVPSIFDERPAVIQTLSTGRASSGRRAALARWVTDPNNPLGSRVIVNRVWQYHFGRGLSANASDFGRLGEKPSHPELLDWLSARFIQEGWSLKKLHRLILTSATYRQSSRMVEDGPSSPGDVSLTQANPGSRPLSEAWNTGQQVDPEDRLFWRGTARRLDAEQVRDALLSASGELDLSVAGPSVDASRFQRSIYMKVLRNSRDTLLDAFDAPQNFSSTSQRDITTTPVQSLLLINSAWTIQRAQAMARRIATEQPDSHERWVRRAYQRAFNRLPDAAELSGALSFLQSQAGRVDTQLALSANAGFKSDRIPFRDGKAAVFPGAASEEALFAPMVRATPSSGDFSIEAYVYLKTGAEGSGYRTIAARWDSGRQEPGWLLGITGKKSERKPLSLFLQLGVTGGSNEMSSSRVHSDLPLRVDRPFFVAACVRSATNGSTQVTFYLKDLSNDDEPVFTAQADGPGVGTWGRFDRLSLGGRLRGGGGGWDGMLDDVRLSDGVLGPQQLLLSGRETEQASVLGFWRFEAQPGYFRDHSRMGNDLEPGRKEAAPPMNAGTLALADLCHALLNSSEFLYVE